MLPLENGMLIAQFLFFVGQLGFDIDFALIMRLWIMFRLSKCSLIVFIIYKYLVKLGEFAQLFLFRRHFIQLIF